MLLPDNAFPTGYPNYGRNYQIINKISIENNELTDNYFHDRDKQLLHWKITDRKGNPIYVNPDDCEWLSQAFFRNENTLYGFSLIEKSMSTKMFLTPVKGIVDFDAFEPLGMHYAKDQYRYYYGPGGKIIKEESLELYHDETYLKEWIALHPDRAKNRTLSLWRSHIAKSGNQLYWKGRLMKDVHASSLKKIAKYAFIDTYSVYQYNLQNIKKIEGVDRASVVYLNHVKESGSIESLITDKYKPMYRYMYNQALDEKFDFNLFTPLFEKYRNELGPDYWWYQLEEKLKSNL